MKKLNAIGSWFLITVLLMTCVLGSSAFSASSGLFSAVIAEASEAEDEEKIEEAEENDAEAEDAEAEELEEESKEDDIVIEENEDVFLLYISGIDNRGEIIEKSRSDTNIIAMVNFETKQVLLISTPRDYYVPLSISDGEADKLTHAGLYGVECSMDTLSMLYGINIENYFKVNFGGFIDIIDALGGITVYSDYEFDSQNELGWHYDQGENELDGEAALVFARERFSFAEGDRQRGKNQMAVIQGVLDKLSEVGILQVPALITSIAGTFETNILPQTILELALSEISNISAWNVVTYSVDGTSAMRKTYSQKAYSSVMVPDESTVYHAKELISQLYAGEILTEEATEGTTEEAAEE